MQSKPDAKANFSEKSTPKPLSLETLYHKYGIERSHAENVAQNALKLFDLLTPLHGLSKKHRKLMEIAALVHDIGISTALETHHQAGQAILYRNPPAEISEKLQPVVAWTTFLHRKKAGKKKVEKLQKTAFSELSSEVQALTLKLAALLRLADALDYSRMGSQIGNVAFKEGAVKLEIKGPGAYIDSERMYKKGDLWALLFKTKLEFSPVTT
ncbi:MAG: HD domain-containing protein [Methanosarcinaceae archaeon]|nr:HD domain-containing protein [Methanosarcinaceae archaeon]MDD4749571.1 HD domain-containing protein [Methanosarcinaceae archaeon]